jgi:protein phosphatase
VLADGQGDHPAGERASQTVVEVIAERLGKVLDRQRRGTLRLAGRVRHAVGAANKELLDLAERQSAAERLGAAAIVGVVYRRQLLIASVGNNRAVLLRGGRLSTLTADDTILQQMVATGALTPREAARHPLRDSQVRNLGSGRLVGDLQTRRFAVRSGDRLVLATDGLADAVTPDELVTLLCRHADPRDAADALADFAVEAGSPDNVSCIVIDIA